MNHKGLSLPARSVAYYRRLNRIRRIPSNPNTWRLVGAIICLAYLLTSCSPYDGLTTPASTPTAARVANTSTPGIASPSPTPTEADLCIVRTGIPRGYLNLRTGAGVSHSIITVLREGQQLTLTSARARGAWIQVRTGRSITGWVNERYCQ